MAGVETMTEEIDQINPKHILMQIMAGIVFSAAVVGTAGALLLEDGVGFILGILVGAVAAGGIAFHLYVTIDKALDMDEKHATSYTRRMVLLRILFMGLPLVVAVLFPRVFNPVGVVFGVLTLKFGAYLQPLAGKFLFKK